MSRYRPFRASENETAILLLDWLRYDQHWTVHRLEADLYAPKHRSKREEAGTPDYICVRLDPDTLQPQAFYLEVKRIGGTLRPAQQIWIPRKRVEGWRVCIASTLEQLKQFLSDHNLIRRRPLAHEASRISAASGS